MGPPSWPAHDPATPAPAGPGYGTYGSTGDQFGSPWPAGGQPGAPSRKRGRRTAIIAAVAVLVVAALVVGYFTVLRRAEVTLVSATGQGPGSPFTPDFATGKDAVTGPALVSSLPQGVKSGTDVTGDTDGLYRSPQSKSVCDRAALAAYFSAHPQPSGAWAAAAGTGSDVSGFVTKLTPVLLRADTRATEFVLDGAVSQADQVVLQAGTAVLIDASGAPRLRCASGDPLAGPRPVSDPTRTSGTAWSGFDAAAPVTITPVSASVPEWGLVDLTDRAFRRPVGSDGAADFDQIPSTATPTGSYYLSGPNKTCAGYTACAKDKTVTLTINVTDCSGTRCSITSDVWQGAVPLDRGSSGWTATGPLNGRFTCDDKDETAKFTLTVTSTAGAVISSRWTASSLSGTLTYDSPATACQRALLVWNVTGSRSGT